MQNKEQSFLSLFLVAASLMASATVFIFITKMNSGPLSNTESGFFAIAVSFVTLAISILASIAISEKTLKNELKPYGKSAMRRIVQSIKGCKSTLQDICLKKSSVEKDGFPSKEVAVEFLNNIYGQIGRLMSTAFDSQDDWKDILKEEGKEVAALDMEFGEMLLKQTQAQKDLEDAKKALEETKGDKTKTEEKVKQLQKELQKTKEELIVKKKEIEEKSISWPSLNTPLPGLLGPLINPFSSPLLGVSGYSGLNDVAYLPQCADCGSFLAGTQLQCFSCSKPICFSCSSTKQISAGTDVLNMGLKCNKCLKKTT